MQFNSWTFIDLFNYSIFVEAKFEIFLINYWIIIDIYTSYQFNYRTTREILARTTKTEFY